MTTTKEHVTTTEDHVTTTKGHPTAAEKAAAHEKDAKDALAAAKAAQHGPDPDPDPPADPEPEPEPEKRPRGKKAEDAALADELDEKANGLTHGDRMVAEVMRRAAERLRGH